MSRRARAAAADLAAALAEVARLKRALRECRARVRELEGAAGPASE